MKYTTKYSTQIVLVGHTKNRLIEGIKHFPTNKLILVLGKNPNLEGELKVIQIADELETLFCNLMDVEKIFINKEDVLQSTKTILKKILEETRANHKIQINISGSLRQMAIACYIASLVSKTPIYSVLPSYDQNFKELGIKEIYEIPFFPIKELSNNSMQILKILNKTKEIESIEQLINFFYSDVTNANINQYRGKISYYLKELELDGFIQKKIILKN
ncbi:MAG: HFX_2341 family transcriptional regulator domain-containing protein [Candidatus Helarchaeota archaeon]